MMNKLTQTELKKILNYDPETGIFIWKVRLSNRVKIGDSAGHSTLSKNGRHYIRISKKLYASARLAWLYMTGDWPKEEIDHINGDCSDNRFCNLREATRQQNSYNITKRNKIGFPGVMKNRSGYSAMITVEKVRHYLGYFRTPEQAHQAYKKAAIKMHGEFASLS